MLEQLARGLAATVARFPARSGGAPCVVLDRLSTCTIAEINHEALTSAVPNDVIAGVLQRFEGPVRGTALFALDPGDALLWLEMEESDEPPLERFVEVGGRVLSAIVGSLVADTETRAAPASESASQAVSQAGTLIGAGVLEERPLVAALLATHAPSDTIILSVDGELAFEIDPGIGLLHTPFTVQLLLEPKLLSGVLAGLRTED